MRYPQKSVRGFTLVEMIVVMALTAILAGVVALFLRWPVQGYIDSARRAGMNDAAELAVSRITRDLRTALPNSVRVVNGTGGATCNGTTDVCYLEFIPTTGGGRYRIASDVNATSPCGSSPASAVLDIGVPDNCFDVLGPMPALTAGDKVVVDNTAANSAYNTNNWSSYVSAVAPAVTINSFTFPSASPGGRFQVVSTPVSYVCDPTAGKLTLTRYWGYAIQPAQPNSVTAAPLLGASSGVLASNVSACSFSLPQANLAALQLTLGDSGDNASLYVEARVDNAP